MGIRFAPSPTGIFHVGNLRTAWISFVWAQALGKPWIVRIEDIDAPRVLPGAREDQMEDMAKLGLRPDSVLTQSEHRKRHWEVFESALGSAVYPCFCSRKDLRAQLDALASTPHGSPLEYSGHCRNLSPKEASLLARKTALPSIAWRFRARPEGGQSDVIIARTSPKLGESAEPLEPESFVPAYHWACAIDDLDGGYDLLVRAGDLAPAAHIQRAIQDWVAKKEGKPFHPSAIFHCSLVVSNDGHRLEKRTQGVTLSELARKGIRPGELLAKFERSFDVTAFAYEPGKLFGEPAETLTLSELGL